MRVRPFHSASLDELTRWAKQLKYFRLVASEGFDKESSDTLLVCIKYTSPSDYLSILDTLGVRAAKLTPGSIQPRTIRSYSAEEIEKIEPDINDVPGYRQPAICKICEQYVFMWAGNGRLKITFSDELEPKASVANKDVECAAIIEKQLEPLAAKMIDPPVDSAYCFCPKYYPHAFIGTV